MIFIEPDGCFRQVSTTLGLFEGRRTLQTTFIPKRFTKKIWSKKAIFHKKLCCPHFSKFKSLFLWKKSIQMVWKKKVCNWQKKCFNEKEISFFEVFHGFIWRVDGSSGEDIPLLNYYHYVRYYSWKGTLWQKLVWKSKNRVSVTERKISSEKSAYL